MKKSGREWAAFFVGVWVILGVAFAAFTFTYKVVEIVRTVPRGDVVGFAAIQVVTYVLVSIGFFCLFVWSFLKGDFKDLERAKYLVLEMEAKAEEMERRG